MADTEEEAVSLGIDGAFILPLRVIDTPGGAVMHMLRPVFPLQPGLPAGTRGSGFLKIGEVYFSEVLPGCVKAWKRHTRQTQHFAVPDGLLGIVLYDDREGSPREGCLRLSVSGAAEPMPCCASPAAYGTVLRLWGESRPSSATRRTFPMTRMRERNVRMTRRNPDSFLSTGIRIFRPNRAALFLSRSASVSGAGRFA